MGDAASRVSTNARFPPLFLGGESLLYAAIVAAIEEVHKQADHQPDNQARPVDPTQFVHHVTVEQHTHDRYQGHPRRAKRSGLSRIRLAKDQDRDTDDYERQECSDVDHFPDIVNRR